MSVTFETAEEHLVRDVPMATPETRCGEFRRSLLGRRFESVATVAVCDDQRRVRGLVAFEALLAAPERATISEVMDAEPPVVRLRDDQELAATRAVGHRETGLAVVDEEGAFQGVIPAQRMLGVLLQEHHEDLDRLAGVIRSARGPLEEPVRRRFLRRLPWLVLGLAGAALAALLVGSFEHELDDTLELAFFVPGIVYIADAVGTQTETLVVRGFAADVRVRSIVRAEIETGVLIGVVLAAGFYPIALVLYGKTDVALAVSLALLAACSVATIVAMALPALLRRLGRDPALGSGPLATVIQDLLSIVIYFAIATALVT